MWAMEELKVASLGEAVRYYRDQAGLTQEQLAERLGVTREAVRKIETGKTRRPGNDLLRKMEDVIGLSYRRSLDLMGEVEPDDDDPLRVLLIQIAALPDPEERRQAWRTLDPQVRDAIMRLAGDWLQDALQRLQAEHLETVPDQDSPRSS